MKYIKRKGETLIDEKVVKNVEKEVIMGGREINGLSFGAHPVV